MEILLGKKKTDLLAGTRIAVFGIGGAGSHVIEALARCGIGSLTVVDHGVIHSSHMNRNLLALATTIGMSKVQAAKERIGQIDESILVHTYETFFGEDTVGLFDFHQFDYVIDVTDSVTSKLLLIKKAREFHVPVLSCLELGNRLDVSALRIMNLDRSHTPMAKLMQMELGHERKDHVKVLCSTEKVGTNLPGDHPEGLFKTRSKKQKQIIRSALTGSISYLYGQAGMMIASEVIQDVLKKH